MNNEIKFPEWKGYSSITKEEIDGLVSLNKSCSCGKDPEHVLAELFLRVEMKFEYLKNMIKWMQENRDFCVCSAEEVIEGVMVYDKDLCEHKCDDLFNDEDIMVCVYCIYFGGEGTCWAPGFQRNGCEDFGIIISSLFKCGELFGELSEEKFEEEGIKLIPIPPEGEEPDTRPDIETVLTNLRMLIGQFMAEQDIDAMNTVYWAEQFIKQPELDKEFIKQYKLDE